MEDKTKWGKVRPLDKRTTDKTPKPKPQYVSHPDSVFYDLGIVRRYSQALQDHAYTHHSPSCEEDNTRGEFDLSTRDEPVKPPTSKTPQDIQMKSIFDELELGMEMNTSSKFSHG
jgi:hypothetical protein